MDTLEALRQQMESTQSLHAVVRTMKVLSLASIRQYEEAVDALNGYYRTLMLGLQAALRHRPPHEPARSPQKHHLGVVVFGAAHGMSGRFNEQLAAFVAEEVAAFQPDARTVIPLGDFIGGHLDAAGMALQDPFPMPESVAGITDRVQELLVTMEAWHVGREVDQVVLFYNRLTSGTSFDPHRHPLFPLDPDWLAQVRDQPWPTRMLPAFTMPWERLFTALLRQYFFVSLYRAFAESLASEHASRLAAMQAAEENIKERLGELQARYHRRRQSAITEELLDVMSGFEALTSGAE